LGKGEAGEIRKYLHLKQCYVPNSHRKPHLRILEREGQGGFQMD
jgi:hypothetical protein